MQPPNAASARAGQEVTPATAVTAGQVISRPSPPVVLDEVKTQIRAPAQTGASAPQRSTASDLGPAQRGQAQPAQRNKAQPAQRSKAQPAQRRKAQPAQRRQAQPGRPTAPPGPRPVPAGRKAARPARRRSRIASLTAAVVLVVGLVVAVGITAIALTGRGGTTGTSGTAGRDGTAGRTGATGRDGTAAPGASAETAIEDLAATWVHDQVSLTAIVACDRAMCHALTTHQFPGRKLRLISPSAAFPAHTQIVVETPVVRSQFGSGLADHVAPETLATFGSGSRQIEIRLIAPSGAAAYRAQLAKDLKARQVGGRSLLGSRFVTASAAARRQLLAGQVDSRIITALLAVASKVPLDILSFGPAATGQSPGLPLRLAVLAGQAAHLSQSGYDRVLETALRGQALGLRPISASPVSQAGKQVFRILFPAPSPLGLSPSGHR